MFVVRQVDDDDIIEYTLSTGFDISTASFVDSFNMHDYSSNAVLQRSPIQHL